MNIAEAYRAWVDTLTLDDYVDPEELYETAFYAGYEAANADSCGCLGG